MQLLLTMKSNYCEIIRICCGSIFVGSPYPQIYIGTQRKLILKDKVFLLKLNTDASTKLQSHEYAKRPWNLPHLHPPSRPRNLNDSTVTNKQCIAIYGQQKSLGFCIWKCTVSCMDKMIKPSV